MFSKQQEEEKNLLGCEMGKEDYPPGWRKVLEQIIDQGKVSMVLGAPDTGKSTFVRLLAREAFARGKRVGVVDADMGQSDIGPPSTVGLGFVERKLDQLSESTLRGLYFIGSFSPEGNLLPAVVGTKKMVDKGLALGAQVLVVDTTGLVHKEAGKILKKSKIELVSPRHLVLLQRNGEAEHLILPLSRRRNLIIHRLSVPSKVRRKSKEARRKYRRERLQAYFKKNFSFILPLEESLLGRNISSFSFPEDDFVNLLVGLEDEEGETLGLGIIKEINLPKKEFSLLTPLGESGRIKRLLLSTIQLEFLSFSP